MRENTHMNEFLVMFANGQTLTIRADAMRKVSDGAFLFHDEAGAIIAGVPIGAVAAFCQTNHVVHPPEPQHEDEHDLELETEL